MEKFGKFMFCFVPILFAVGIQVLWTIPVTGILLLKYMTTAAVPATLGDMMNEIMKLLLSTDYSLAVELLYAASVVIIFGAWYNKKFYKFKASDIPASFSIKMVIGLVLLVPGIQFLCNYIVAATAAIHPAWLDHYKQLLETAGFNDLSFGLILYGIIIGPICEELIFRGITLHYAKKVVPFWVANLLQAVLFGAFHMNVIQGVYAFAIGLILGLIFKLTKSIYPVIVLHMLVNSWGFLMDEDTLAWADTDSIPVNIIIFVVSIVVCIAGVKLVASGTKKQIEC